MNFNIMSWPECCIALIVYDFSTTYPRNRSVKTSADLDELCRDFDATVIYALDIENQTHLEVMQKLGFEVMDVNHNCNSGNLVYLMKYVYNG